MGLKFRIHSLAAAIALDQLSCLDRYLEGRATIAAYLCEHLAELPGLIVPKLPLGVRSSWYGLPLRYSAEKLDGLPIERFSTKRCTPRAARR
jgi:perosamine synthetase